MKIINSIALLLLLGFVISVGGCAKKTSDYDFTLISNQPERIIYTKNGSKKVFTKDAPAYGKLNLILLQSIERGISTAQTAVSLNELESAGEQALHYEFPDDTTVKLEHPPVKKLEIKTIVIPFEKFRDNIIFNPGAYLYGPVDAQKFKQEVD